jgi:hypothetical protein
LGGGEKMDRKLVGIFVFILLTAVPVLSVTGTINDDESCRDFSTDFNYAMQHILNQGGPQGEWQETAKFNASDGVLSDHLGVSVALDGDYALLGASGDDDNGDSSGSAYIFKRTSTGWEQEDKLLPSDGAEYDNFGSAVSISGDYAVVGTEDHATFGAVYIFKRDDTNWYQHAKLIDSDPVIYDYFGRSVSIEGEYLAVGAGSDDVQGVLGAGSVSIFKRNDTAWTLETKLVASDRQFDDRLGCSVSIYGVYAIGGAPYDDDNGDNSGSAYVFKRNDTGWTQMAKLLPTDGEKWDMFGNSVSINEDYAVVGSVGDDDNGDYSGAAYIFKRGGTTWYQHAKLTASDATEDAHFGESVSINGDTIIIGAHYDDDNGDNSGSAYVFKRVGTTWTEEAKLIASDGTPYDYFGKSVSTDGDYALVGSYSDDNGKGAGYVFTRKKAVPDLDCEGSLSWDNVKPGSTVRTFFTVENIGEPESLLDWEVESTPDWGTWTFTPVSGTDLSPDDGVIIVGVTVVAPDETNVEFSGEVKVVNSANSSDYCILQVSLVNSFNQHSNNMLVNRLLARFLRAFSIL